MTKFTATRASPGQCGCGGLPPYPIRSRGVEVDMACSFALERCVRLSRGWPERDGRGSSRSSGNDDGEWGRDGNELLVARRPVAPHEDGKRGGPVEDGDGMVPRAHGVRHALTRAGDEGAKPREVGTAAG